ncbi:MAG: hypothetical protein R2694_20115 [Ilumatobacteraceae bacterium]|nr:hypothetical protein [Ilumatobacter sp.]MCB0985733.1 hypothetical protein [Ilumatobacter sp.]
MSTPPPPAPDGAHVEVHHAGTIWRFEQAFLQSNWTCTWGRGCQGILDEPAEHLQQGCCSVGTAMADAEEAMTLAAYAEFLTPDGWQFHTLAHAAGHLADGIFRDGNHTHTALADDACIFLNRPGFPGGAGCALHLAALEAGESPIDWKPSVCWQLPLRTTTEVGAGPDGEDVVTVNRWARADWDEGGATMAWCCTEPHAQPSAYVGDVPVIVSLAPELAALAGNEVAVQLRRALGVRPEPQP